MKKHITRLTVSCMLILASIACSFGGSGSIKPTNTIQVRVPTEETTAPSTLVPPANTKAARPTGTAVQKTAPPTVENTPIPSSPTPGKAKAIKIAEYKGNIPGLAQLAQDGLGIIHIAWFDTGSDTASILHRQRDIMGDWSDVEELASGEFGQITPTNYQLLNTPDGRVCLIWLDESDPELSAINMRCYINAQWSQVEKISEISTRSICKSYTFNTAFPTNNSPQVLKCVRNSSNQPQLFFGDQSLSDPIQGTGYDVSQYKLVIDQQDGYHVIWLETLPNFTHRLQYRFSKDNGQSWQPAVPLTNDETSPVDFRLQADSQGGIQLTWLHNKDSVVKTLYYQHWIAETGWSVPENIIENIQSFDMSIDPTGLVHLTFEIGFLGQAQIGWGGIGYLMQNADGKWTEPSQVAADQATPILLVGKTGEQYFLWEIEKELYFAER
jgi:hypothetical protein